MTDTAKKKKKKRGGRCPFAVQTASPSVVTAVPCPTPLAHAHAFTHQVRFTLLESLIGWQPVHTRFASVSHAPDWYSLDLHAVQAVGLCFWEFDSFVGARVQIGMRRLTRGSWSA